MQNYIVTMYKNILRSNLRSISPHCAQNFILNLATDLDRHHRLNPNVREKIRWKPTGIW